jgi:hypothetical protein
MMPEEMVTLAGTVTAALLLDSATTAFPEAALTKVTVQFDVAPAVIAAGLHVKDATGVNTFTLMVAWADPL